MSSQNSQNTQNVQNPSREYFTVGIALKNIHDEILLIKEPKERGGKWRLPCSRLHEGDDLPQNLSGAASVIGTKLTGYDFDEHDICYVGLHEGPNIAVIYVADQPYDVSLIDRPDTEEVAAVGWFTYNYVIKLNEDGLLRDPELTLAAIKNAQNGLTVPAELITI